MSNLVNIIGWKIITKKIVRNKIIVTTNFLFTIRIIEIFFKKIDGLKHDSELRVITIWI